MSSMGKRAGCILMIIVLVLCIIPQSSYASETDATEVIEVPEEGMVISGGTYYGISKAWYEENNPEGKELSLSLEIPSRVERICNDGFRDRWSNEKQRQKCITNYNYGGDKKYTDKYEVVNIDFSKAVNLNKIGNQAAMYGSLSGVLDLSKTKVETIGKSAFSGCSGITGVILPSTLKELGSKDSGSVFNRCSSIEFFRVAGGDSNAIFELPENLEIIGNQSFSGCVGLPDGTEITIPESVTYLGNQAFDTRAITTITVKTNDASEYNGGAFKSNSGYGLGKRLTVFNNSAAKNTFKPSTPNAYKDSITYEFKLYYGEKGTAKPEVKLYGQPINVCKNDDGSWSENDNYQIPEVSDGIVRVGYDCGWEYNEKIVKKTTVLRPTGDELLLKTGYVLQNPTIEFIVDGEVIETEDTYPELSLTNNEPHIIGVSVSHPIQTVENADVDVKFEFAWTDVWKGGSEGPRMSESGFGKYDSNTNPDVSNTITINGPQHERTKKGNYSGEDYGDGYYLVEIYGYSMPKSGGEWELFYKSAHTKIGISDPYRTVNTAYRLDVTTYAPPEKEDDKPDDGNGDSDSTYVFTDRIGGEDRFETAVKVAERLKSRLGVKKFDTIIVAASSDFADALSAAPLAAAKDAPILVVNEYKEKYVKEYIDANLAPNGMVYIIGETEAVPESFEKRLASHNVTRLGGADRYETNLKVLKELKLPAKTEVMIASGLDYADALTASATGNPIMLVKNGVFDYQMEYLKTLGGDDEYFVIGGTEAVNEKVFSQVEDFAGEAVRVWGDDRFETAKDVADRFFKTARAVYIASGCDFPDALTGGVIAYKNNAPLLLVSESKYSEAARFVDTHNVRKVTAIGGPAAVSDKVLRAVAR